MDDFDFVIPLSVDALQESTSTRQYVVYNVSLAKEVPQALKDAQVSFHQTGPHFILQAQSFDALYSVVLKFATVEDEFRQYAWRLVLRAMAKLTGELSLVLDEGELDSKGRHRWLNALKMTTYLACHLTEAFENDFNKPTKETLVLGKQGRKKSAKKSDSEGDWEEERTRMLTQLFSVLQLPVQRLWDPPVMEEDFVNLIANCCYKLLESPTMNLQRTKPARDSIFQTLGTLVKKFNHGLACSLKLMQLLQHFEHMVTPAAQGVALIIETFGANSVLSEMVREIAKTDSQELAKDTSGMRNYSLFLVEVAEKCPQVLLPSLSMLVNFLDEDLYSMRNCVLSILSHVVAKLLSGDSLEPRNKELRDQCLDHLEDHIHDVHAFVRSKVLHLWADLVSEKVVPLRRQQHVLRLVIGRLRDKSSNVRKAAIQLITEFLKGNPFAAKLPLEDLKAQYESELQKLQEMAPNTQLDDSVEHRPIEDLVSGRELWQAMVPEVVKIVLDLINEGANDEEDDGEDQLDEDVTMNDAVTEIAEALTANKLRRGVKLLEAAIEKFHGAAVFGYDPDIHSVSVFEKASGDEELSEYQLRHLVVMERIFLSAMEMRAREGEEPMEEGEKKEDEEGEEKENEEESETLKEKEHKAEVNKQKLLVNYLKDCVGFAKLINTGLPVLCQLLGSKHVSDVLEAINFFVTAFEFGLLNAMTGVRQMLARVYSKEAAIKDAVIAAYRRLYIDIDTPNDRARAQHIVRNLSALTTGATLGERYSMEDIIAEFVKSGDITKACVTLLWERFTKRLPDTTDDDARAALVLLGMCANTESSIISSNITVLCSSGLGERGRQDYMLVKETCIAMRKLAVAKPKTDDPNPPFRLDRDHEFFTELAQILLEGLTVLEDRQYSPMALEATCVIYELAEHPDMICGEILQKMCKKMQSLHTEADDGEEDSQSEGGLRIPVGVFSRFLVFAGHVALRQMIHLDTYIFSELKRRNHVREEAEDKKKKRKSEKKSKKNSRRSLATSASEVSMNRGSSQDGDMDEEMGLTGAVADDMEAEYIRSICDTELIHNDNLLGLLMPLLMGVCTNPGKYPDSELRSAATLTLVKFMMVSTSVCEENLQMLFTILEKSEEETIRANTVIALGDLSFRFPNELEPWTPRIYARLRDESSMVRHKTLSILTHLILNDMVKVKGQISDMALCITDENPKISGLAKLFFNELSRKGNALYNVLPDIISRLSDSELGIEEDRYRTIIGHILSLVQKDRQLETLVEKLCHRFQAMLQPRQWRDVAYCLSLFTYNEKCIRKLGENFSCYGDKLHEPEVYEMFLGILAGARKVIKAECRAVVDELEAKLEERHRKGVDDERALNTAANAKGKGRTKRMEKPGKGRVRSNRKRVESSSEEEEDEEIRTRLHPVHKNRESLENNRHSRKKSNDDDDVFNSSRASRVSEKDRRSGRGVKKSQSDSEEEFTPTRPRKASRVLEERNERVSRSSRRK